MASVGVVPDHSSDEQLEKGGNEDLKTIEQGGIPPSKENKVIDGEEEFKAEEPISVKVPTEPMQEADNIQIALPATADAEKVEKFDEAPDSDVPVTDDSQVGQIEKGGNEELKTIEQGDPPSNENKVIDGEEKSKAEESVSVKAPIESEQEAANIQIVPPAIADTEKVKKFDEAPDSDVPVTDNLQVEVSSDSKLVISSVPESVVEAVEEKTEESSKIPDVTDSSIEALEKKPVEHLEASPTKDSEPEVGKEPEEVSVVEPKIVENPESIAEMERKPQEQSEEFEEKSETLEPKESVDKDITIDGGIEADELLKEEASVLEPKIVEKPESVVEVVGKLQEAEEVEEKSETLKPKESIDNDSRKDEETQADESFKEEVSVVEPEALEKTESVVEMGGQPQEQVEEAEKKSEMFEPKESMDIGVTKDEATPIDMVEKYTEPLKEEEVTKNQGIVASESDTVACAGQEAESALKEDGLRSVTPDVVENVSVDDTKKEVGVDEEKAAVQVGDSEAKKEEKIVNIEEGKDKDVKIEELTKPEQTESIEEKEAKDRKIDENEENNVKKDELMLAEPAETKNVDDSSASTGVIEESSKEQIASKDAKMVIEEKKEQDVNEPIAESKESVLEGKVEEAIDNEDKREETVEETAKSDGPNVELSKLEDNSKTDQEPPSREAPAKPSQKQSNTIISKVKQSFVKVKRAIIGKSPSSKTLSSEAKADIQVK